MTRGQKRFILIVVDALIIYTSGFITQFFLDNYIDLSLQRMLVFLTAIWLVYLICGYATHVYSILNRFTDYIALWQMAKNLLLSYAISVIVIFSQKIVFSYRFILLSYIFSLLLIGASRLIWRMTYEFKDGGLLGRKSAKAKRTLVVGAGQGADLFLKTANRSFKDIDVIGIVDKDSAKWQTLLHGVRVLGSEEKIPEIVKNYEIEQIVIAIPSLNSEEYARVYDICKRTKAKVYSIPRQEDILSGQVSVSKLREIDIVDLLGRQEVELDQSSLYSNIQGKTILVTGAGGSIGSELCRQLIRFSPARMLLLGHGENSIYLIHKELSMSYRNNIEIIPIIADIQDRERIFQIMAQYHPDRVYHAAAHKHVPLMEYNPTEAVKNNIYGTKNVAEAAKEYGVEKFVMISTDKAVNPPNIMGATKRVAEMIVTSLNEPGKTRFAAVRFGNVLGSRGSVVPLFKEQIAKGGPVTVTDFRMTRFFMTIPEASRLVIQAGALMNGGEIFILDMGEPVKILDLAKKIISLSGYSEEEIGIVESGIRPGEKLYEELLATRERTTDQIYDKIFVGRVTYKQREEIEEFISTLLDDDSEILKNRLLEFAKQE